MADVFAPCDATGCEDEATYTAVVLGLEIHWCDAHADAYVNGMM